MIVEIKLIFISLSFDVICYPFFLEISLKIRALLKKSRPENFGIWTRMKINRGECNKLYFSDFSSKVIYSLSINLLLTVLYFYFGFRIRYLHISAILSDITKASTVTSKITQSPHINRPVPLLRSAKFNSTQKLICPTKIFMSESIKRFFRLATNDRC